MRMAVLAVVAATLLLGASAAGAPGWGTPVQISTGERALGPELAINAGDDGLVVWDQEVGSVCPTEPASLSCTHIVEASTRSGGGPWSAPVEISRPGIGALPTAALNDAGSAVIAWVHDIGRDRVLQATYRTGATGAFPEPNDISEASLQVVSHETALDAAGDAVVVWAERAQDVFAAYAAVRSSVTGGWGAPMKLSGAAGVVGGPDLAVAPSGRAEVAWVDAANVVRVVQGDLVSGTWGAVATPSGSGGPPKRSPRIATNSLGDVAVVWLAGESTAGAPRKIWHAVRPHGSDWREARTLDGAASTATAPAVAVDEAGNVHIAWLGPRGVEAQRALIGVDSNAWGSWALVSRGGAYDPQLAVDRSGNAVAVWTVGGQGSIQAAIEPATGEWQPQTQLTPPDALSPRVAMGARGRAVVVFDRGSSQRLAVGSADLAGAGPVLAGLRAPMRALVVGERGRFSVRPTPWSAPLEGTARWAFGDSTEASGTSVRHAYSRSGHYVVTVSQADTAGGTSTARVDIDVVRSHVRNRTLPWIQGVPRVGNTVTCRRGAWTGTPPVRFTYAWRRDGSVVAKRTQRTYRLGPRDLGSLIACEVTATNPAGSARAVSAIVGVER
jgi:PKD domain